MRIFIKPNSKLLFAVLLSALAINTVNSQDLKAEEIVAKHLDSLGTKQKRDEVKTRIASGTSSIESKLPSISTSGKAIVVSDASNLFYLSSFSSKEYPFEKIGIFSEKISLPFVIAGARSPLGAFIADHSKLLSDGLFTGTMSTMWGLQSPKGKLEMVGKKKVDGQEMYVLNYFPKGGGESFSIRLFFDASNFQHLRTEYRDTLSAQHKKAGVLGDQTGVIISMTEIFGDYKDEAGLTLPHSYRIKYMTDSNAGTYEWTWGITVSQYFFNQKLDPGFFTFEPKEN